MNITRLLGELLEESTTGKMKKGVKVINGVNDLKPLIADNILQLANPDTFDLVPEENLDEAIRLLELLTEAIIIFGKAYPVPRPTLPGIKR